MIESQQQTERVKKASALTLGTAGGHDKRSVVLAEFGHANVSARCTNARKLARDLDLECALLVRSRGILEETTLGVVDVTLADVVGGVNELVLVGDELRAGDDVVDAE